MKKNVLITMVVVLLLTCCMPLPLTQAAYVKRNTYTFNVVYKEKYQYKELHRGKWKFSELKLEIDNILKKHNLYNRGLSGLLIGTAVVESNLGFYLKQRPGPARGIFQKELTSVNFYAWNTFKKFKENKKNKGKIHPWEPILKSTLWENVDLEYQLKHNLEYQVVLATYMYKAKGVNIKNITPNIDNYAKIWKKYWNTYKGKGTIKKFKERWKKENC